MAARYRKSLPKEVARELRQEAGFGCARCGYPYLEYHHIVPFHEDEHFRAEDMIAVCATCHGVLEVHGRDRQYRLKENPANFVNGEHKGKLEYDQRDLVFKIGGNWYENVPTILRFKQTPLVSCRLADDQALVSIRLFNRSGRLVMRVVDNEVTFRMGAVWDYECKRRVAIVRSGPRDIALKMDFSGRHAVIEGKLWAGGELLRLGADDTNIGGLQLSGSTISDCNVGIQVGE